MRVLRLLLVASVVTPSYARAQQPPPASRLVTIEGTVVDDERAPVPNAELGLKLVGLTPMLARSDKLGYFAFADIPLSPGAMTVRRLGYKPRTFAIDIQKIGSGQRMEVALETVATDVEPVIVDAAGGRMSEFNDHRQQSSFGHFFDQKDIQKISPRYTSELFRTIPGATVHVSSGFGNTVELRGCRPRIYINGVKTVNAELDEVVRPSEIDGLEIYPSWAGTPPQYMDRETRACGTVVIWTRR